MKRCPSCGAEMQPRTTKYGQFFDCTGTGCTWRVDATGHGGDLPTRRARMRAHTVFDRIWRNGPLTRSEAYVWLQKAMGTTEAKGRIKQMTKDECDVLVEKVRAEWESD